MRRLWIVSLCLAVTSVIFAGCSRQAEPKSDAKNRPEVVLAPNQEPRQTQDAKVEPSKVTAELVAFTGSLDEKQEKFEAAIADALNLLASQKLADALVALETAQTFQDNDFIKGEIDKVRGRIEQQSAAKKTVAEIGAVLEDGKGAEAAKLAQAALKEFGGGEAADQIVKLCVQADALQNVQAKEDDDARLRRLRDEAKTALDEKNLRAAVLAYEQALTIRDDSALKDQVAELRANLEKYDSLRKRAAELRRDPTQLEEALAALQEAAKAWDTLQLRQDIDEYNLALQKRRDNVSVADFEVRGDVGFPEAGKTIAEELLPTLKPRFDLVERGQIAKVLDELKFEQNALDDPNQQREFGKLAKIRFLVLGSVQRLAGVSVNARLVDVRTGLVMQTAKIVAPTAEDALKQLSELGKQLLMTDQEKMAYEDNRAQEAKLPEPPADNAPLPPPPQVAAKDVPAPPPPMVNVPPPLAGGLRVDAFQNLPPPPPSGQIIVIPPPAPEVVVRVKHRLLHAALHLGDNLFRRGLYRDAHRQFEFALTLAPGNFDIQLRLDNVRPFLPPPPVVVVVDQPVVVLRPRVAVLNFVVAGDPFVVPPSLGPWTAYNLAPYFSPYYDIVDSSEVYWYMGQMGLTLRDLMENPAARQWLGRALGVRYFVLGTIQQTASFDVSTYLIDSEFGYLQGSGRIHVQNPFELKLRLGELAQVTVMNPSQRQLFLEVGDRFAAIVLRGRQALDRSDIDTAIAAFNDALVLRPGHIEVLAYLERARFLGRVAILERQRRGLFVGVVIYDEGAARRRARELAAAAELARIHAAQEAAARAEADRILLEEQRRRAQGVLLSQARFAVNTKNFSFAVNIYNGATAIAPPQENVVREFAIARVEADRIVQARIAEQSAAREAALRQERERELANVQAQLQRERQRAAAAIGEQKRLQEERDKAAYKAAFSDAQAQLAKSNYDAAIASLQLARRLQKSDAAEALLAHAVTEQAKTIAKGDAERQALEQKLAKERERRKLAEQEAKRNQDLYKAALDQANKALAQKEFDAAKFKFQEAGNVFQTDAVLTGLKQVEAARTKALADIDSARQKTLAEQEKAGRLQKLMSDSKTALSAQKFAEAVDKLQQAKRIAPDNLEVVAALSKAEQARDKALAETVRKTPPGDKIGSDPSKDSQAAKKAAQDAIAADALKAEALKKEALKKEALKKEAEQLKLASFQKSLQSGQAALQGKKFEEAVRAFQDAARLFPSDQKTLALLGDAQKAWERAKADDARVQEYGRLIKAGSAALAAKKFIDAQKSYGDALKLNPGDAEATRGLQEALRGLDAPKAKDVPKTKDVPKSDPKAEARENFQKEMNRAAALEKDKKYEAAWKAYLDALKHSPDDAKAKDKAKQTEYIFHVQEGQKHLDAKRYTEAVREFEAALALYPNTPAVTKLLQKAKQGKN